MHNEYLTLASPFRQHSAALRPHPSVTLIASSLQSGTETRGILNEPASGLPGQGRAIVWWLQLNVAWGSSLCPAKWLIFLRPQTVASCSVKDNISVVPALLQIIHLVRRMDAAARLGGSCNMNHLFLLHHAVFYLFKVSNDPPSPTMVVALWICPL